MPQKLKDYDMNDNDRHRFPLNPFNDQVDAQDLRREWEEWHRAFELVLQLRNVEDQHEKLVTMLAMGERGLQRIFFNLRPVAEEIIPEPVKIPLMPLEFPEYDNAVKRLTKFFIGKRNERVELELFRSLCQNGEESFNNNIPRLRAQAVRFLEVEIQAQSEPQKVTSDSLGSRLVNGLDKAALVSGLRAIDAVHPVTLKTLENVLREEQNATIVDSEVPTLESVVYVPGNVELVNRGMGRITVESHALHNDSVECRIDTVPIEFVIDSGSAINAVTEDVWKLLVAKDANIFRKRYQCDRKFYPYANQDPLNVIAIFEAWISVNPTKPKSYAEFSEIEGARKSLLSKRTSEELRVLKIGLHVLQIDQNCKRELNTPNETFPKFPGIQVKLFIDPTVPPRKIAYLRIPAALEKKVDDKIEEMLRSDVIERVEGPADWISPMVIVPKGKDDVRICINMKHPNEAIQREHYPLPVIETFLNKLRGSKVYSRLDITSAYHHVELHPESRCVTTFMTGRGLMQFKRLMLGITCAPEIFQRIMTEMLAGIDGVIVYIDDIVVSGRTKQEHDARLQQVLMVLERNNAMLNKSKCIFGVEKLQILGFEVSANGVSPSDKILAIRNFRQPSSKEEVRSFLGLINFVGQFIPNLSSRTEWLRQYLRGEVDAFGEDQLHSFNDLRNELCNNVRKLGFFDANDSTEVYVDASPVGLGAVLAQRDKNNVPRIICFASKGLTRAERVYPQTQREALAVVWAVKKFYLYLFGLRFTIFTDHKALEYIYGDKHRDGKRTCSRAEGWALRLQPYDFEIKYVPGPSNISDVLSRLVVDTGKPFEEHTDHFLFTVGEAPLAITLKEMRQATIADETLVSVTKALETQDWPPELFRYQAIEKELAVIEGIVVRDDRIVLPTKFRQRALHIAHRGHPGVIAMRRNIREKIWWPCMDRDVTNVVQECAGCAVVSRQYPPEPLIRKEMPERSWQEIGIDFFSAKDCATFLVVVDYYSRFLRVLEMKSTTAAKTIEALEEVFREQTYSETVRCDNGPPFASEAFAEYCKGKNIKLIRTIPYWPQMNGLVERQNQGILRTLRIAKATNCGWRKAIQDYVYMYNTTPHSVTEKAPLELMTGRPVKDLLPSLRTDPHWCRDAEVRERDAMKKMLGKHYADKRRHAKSSDIEVGDSVILRNYETGKLEPKFRLEKFTVLKRNGSDTVVSNEEGVIYRRPVTHLRKFPSSGKNDESEDQASDVQNEFPEVNDSRKASPIPRSTKHKQTDKHDAQEP
ncbi:uncharacterized protein K02A2.6-like [Wyeomyia smithii]|uniref:uncharacterized protein K02A2.6-like n=1 Tax=Wyeomyia smithii TaxID=174621 RepID=UPI002467B1DA|nr:uncharacterized protein K02A2.6-like [Wyeomyia smithii]